MLRKIVTYVFLAAVFVMMLNLVIASVPKPEYTLYPGQQQLIVEGYLVLPVSSNGQVSPVPLAMYSGRIIFYKRPYPTM